MGVNPVVFQRVLQQVSPFPALNCYVFSETIFVSTFSQYVISSADFNFGEVNSVSDGMQLREFSYIIVFQ